MKDLEEAAADYLDSDRFKNINYDEDWKNKLTLEIEKETKIAFKAGVEFAQRWIPLEEELPTLNTLLQVKGIREGGKIGYDFAKFEFKKGLCAYHLIRATHWRPIELK